VSEELDRGLGEETLLALQKDTLVPKPGEDFCKDAIVSLEGRTVDEDVIDVD